LKTLQVTENSLRKKSDFLRNNETLTTLLKTINDTINKIKNEAEEAKHALDNIKKLYLSVR
jgi:hypothetical protein